jgi:general secretion pathway protein B
MSYILDALRRADAERSRGAVPGVHAQPLAPGAGAGAGRAPRSVPLAWVAVGGLLVLVGVLGWRLLRTEAPRVVVAAAPPRAVEPLPPPEVPTAAPLPVQAEAPPAREAPTVPRKPAKRAVTPMPRQPAPQASAPEGPPVVKQAELPPQIRSQLPSLQVGGSVYSENPASRYLILDGQLFRENAEVAKDLTLEQIGLRSAVFRFKDYRYSIE